MQIIQRRWTFLFDIRLHLMESFSLSRPQSALLQHSDDFISFALAIPLGTYLQPLHYLSLHQATTPLVRFPNSFTILSALSFLFLASTCASSTLNGETPGEAAAVGGVKLNSGTSVEIVAVLGLRTCGAREGK